MGLRVSFGVALGFAALVITGAANAQDNLDQGKTPAQIFASDCAMCHKSPQGLSKAGGLFGLSSFLRQHYTASRETAAAMAAYVEQVDRASAPAQRKAQPRRAARGDQTSKPAAKTPGAAKPADGVKPGEAKTEAPPAAEAKATESKPAEAKPAEAKPAEAKPAEPKASEAKPAEAPKSE